MTTIEDAVKAAVEAANPGAKVEVGPPVAVAAPAIPPSVAANILVMLNRVQVTGPEAIAWVEAVQHLTPLAGPPPTGPGVPFPTK